MVSLAMRDVTFGHASQDVLLSRVSLQLTAGWSGVVGPNGSGKTTLLSLLAGELAPDEGTVVTRPSHARVAVVRQTLDAPDAGVTAFALDMSPEARRLHARFGLDALPLDRWLTLSPGQRQRWQFAAAFAGDPHVLLVDEPTNHLDSPTREALVQLLRAFDGIGVVVSHDRALLDGLTTSTLRVARGAVTHWPLPYSRAKIEWEREQRTREDASRTARDAARKAQATLGSIRGEAARADDQRSSRTRMKGPKDHDARDSLAKGLAEMGARSLARRVTVARASAARSEAEAARHTVHFEHPNGLALHGSRAAAPVLATLQGEVSTPEGHVVMRDVNVRVGRDDKIWIRGPNGTGKSSLMHALVHACTLPAHRWLYLPQELDADDRVALVENVRKQDPMARGRVLALAASMGADAEKLLGTRMPSPGEARKLALAEALTRECWVLFLDEPTHHFDLPTLERLELTLGAFAGALVLVSHDEAFAQRCTQWVWNVENGAVVQER